jgi:hypothetical protein
LGRRRMECSTGEGESVGDESTNEKIVMVKLIVHKENRNKNKNKITHNNITNKKRK